MDTQRARGSRKRVNGGTQIFEECTCSCGVTKSVRVVGDTLVSAGCLSCAKARHGHCRNGKGSPEWQSWAAMLERAKKHPDYANRPIAQRWRVFENFLADMGARPSGTTLDRIDNALGYEPGNCRWATKTEQARNRKSTIYLWWHYRRYCLAELLALSGQNKGTFYKRVKRGWSIDRVMLGVAA